MHLKWRDSFDVKIGPFDPRNQLNLGRFWCECPTSDTLPRRPFSTLKTVETAHSAASSQRSTSATAASSTDTNPA